MKFRMKFSLCFWLLLALCTAWGVVYDLYQEAFAPGGGW